LFPEIKAAFAELYETLPIGCDDRIFPTLSSKKSLGSFISKIAVRAGLVLWEKPFLNMRSTRATELIAECPAHIVNAIMGHTEAVAMKHYRQVLDDDIERLSQFWTVVGERSLEKLRFCSEKSGLRVELGEGEQPGHDRARKGLNGVETAEREESVLNGVSVCDTMTCNENGGCSTLPHKRTPNPFIDRVGRGCLKMGAIRPVWNGGRESL
jgi:hypothetical protein